MGAIKKRGLNELDKFRRRVSWLMDNEKFSEVEKMLLAGVRLSKIVRYVASWPEVAEYGFSISKIKSDLSYLRRNYPRLRNLDAIKYYDDLRKVELEINELKEMVDLYKIQKDRIMVDYRLEKEVLKKLIPTLSREVQVALDILKAIAVLKDKLSGKYSFAKSAEVVEDNQIQVNDKNIKNVLDFIEKALKINWEGSYGDSDETKGG